MISKLSVQNALLTRVRRAGVRSTGQRGLHCCEAIAGTSFGLTAVGLSGMSEKSKTMEFASSG